MRGKYYLGGYQPVGGGVQGQVHRVVGDLLMVNEPVLPLALLQGPIQHRSKSPEKCVLLRSDQ